MKTYAKHFPDKTESGPKITLARRPADPQPLDSVAVTGATHRIRLQNRVLGDCLPARLASGALGTQKMALDRHERA